MTETDDAGTRAIRMEVEVPGTPEEVWEAIATGYGISAWFVPTEVEGHSAAVSSSTSVRGWTQKGPSRHSSPTPVRLPSRR